MSMFGFHGPVVVDTTDTDTDDDTSSIDTLSYTIADADTRRDPPPAPRLRSLNLMPNMTLTGELLEPSPVFDTVVNNSLVTGPRIDTTRLVEDPDRMERDTADLFRRYTGLALYDKLGVFTKRFN